MVKRLLIGALAGILHTASIASDGELNSLYANLQSLSGALQTLQEGIAGLTKPKEATETQKKFLEEITGIAEKIDVKNEPGIIEILLNNMNGLMDIIKKYAEKEEVTIKNLKKNDVTIDKYTLKKEYIDQIRNDLKAKYQIKKTLSNLLILLPTLEYCKNLIRSYANDDSLEENLNNLNTQSINFYSGKITNLQKNSQEFLAQVMMLAFSLDIIKKFSTLISNEIKTSINDYATGRVKLMSTWINESKYSYDNESKEITLESFISKIPLDVAKNLIERSLIYIRDSLTDVGIQEDRDKVMKRLEDFFKKNLPNVFKDPSSD